MEAQHDTEAPAHPPTDASKRARKRRRKTAAFIWIVTIATYALLAFAYLLPLNLRETGGSHVTLAWTAFMLRTFIFHIGVAMTVASIAAIMLRRGRLLIATIPIVAFGLIPEMRMHIPRATQPADGELLRVMSMNMLGTNPHTDALIAEIRAADPDVVFLQEYTPDLNAALTAGLSATYPHRREMTRTDFFGIAVYSKRPFAEPVDSSVRLGPLDTPKQRVVLTIAGRPVVFYNIHVVPPVRPRWFRIQQQEIADLLERIAQESKPVVLVGDFNMTDRCAMAGALRTAGWRDTHALAGRNRGGTWPNTGWKRHLPGVRIDHIYIPDAITCQRSTVGRGAGSDHRPIIAEIGLRAN